MRLAQLSRKVNTNTEEILKFLKSELNVELENDPNAKIEDEHVDAVLAQFQPPIVEEDLPEPVASSEEEAPAEEEEVKEEVEEVIAPAETEDSPEEATPEKEVIEAVNEETSEEESTTADDSEEQAFIEVEVDEDAPIIKAPKVQLEGIKVVGKIDLPTKAVEEEEEEIDDTFDENASLPTAEEVEAEIEREEKAAALFAESGEPDDLLDELEQSQKAVSQDVKVGKTVVRKAKEVEENVEEEEYSIYKDKRGNYRFTREQRENRAKRLKEVAVIQRQKAQKAKKEQHYKEMMETKAAPPVKKKPKKISKKSKDKEQKEAPKSAWGKFLRWLND